MKTLKFLIICSLFVSSLSKLLNSCAKKTACYGAKYCESHCSPINLSKMTCFGVGLEKNELKFTMGTDKPVFKSDGESPSREVRLSPFCMDQTEVSNLQFYQFIKETNHKTEVN